MKKFIQAQSSKAVKLGKTAKAEVLAVASKDKKVLPMGQKRGIKVTAVVPAKPSFVMQGGIPGKMVNGVFVAFKKKD